MGRGLVVDGQEGGCVGCHHGEVRGVVEVVGACEGRHHQVVVWIGALVVVWTGALVVVWIGGLVVVWIGGLVVVWIGALVVVCSGALVGLLVVGGKTVSD